MPKEKNIRKIHGGFLLYDKPDFLILNPIFYSVVLDKKKGIEMFEKLRCKPRTLGEFCDKHDIYNKLKYAQEKVLCDTVSCIGTPKSSNLNRGFISVTQEFKQKTELRKGSILSLTPKKSYDRKACQVEVQEVTGCNVRFIKKVKTSVEYGIPHTVHPVPSIFNFCAWNCTIEEIRTGLDIASDVVFPKITAKEISTVEYIKREKALLKTLNFTKPTFNMWQKRAIAGILLRHTAKIPYVLFGPPGTGKTTTLVEAVVQLVRASLDNRILVCTPSNAAADLFALALKRTGQLDLKMIFRVFSPSHFPEDKDEELLDLTYHIYHSAYGKNTFGIPVREEILQKRVCIMTLACSSYFVSGRMQGCFSHIIIDEAGQAHEIETLVPISGLGTEETRFVLAGDPKQLGPVEIVNCLRSLNLNISLLERFVTEVKFYARQDTRFMSMLRENYRSHQALVNFPSRCIYDGKLVAAVPVSERSSMCQWEELPNKGFPMFFHSVYGVEERQANSHSYRNVAEAKLILYYMKKLISEGVKPSEIGIVTPYKYQVNYFMDNLAFGDVTVDSVEKFQGSERRVILVSTVRTRGIGFLDCPKRLNTTITRAKELLVLVGHYENMTRSSNWRGLIKHLRNNKSIIHRTVTKRALNNSLKNSCRLSRVGIDLFEKPRFSSLADDVGAIVEKTRHLSLNPFGVQLIEKQQQPGELNLSGVVIQKQKASGKKCKKKRKNISSKQRAELMPHSTKGEYEDSAANQESCYTTSSSSSGNNNSPVPKNGYEINENDDYDDERLADLFACVSLNNNEHFPALESPSRAVSAVATTSSTVSKGSWARPPTPPVSALPNNNNIKEEWDALQAAAAGSDRCQPCNSTNILMPTTAKTCYYVLPPELRPSKPFTMTKTPTSFASSSSSASSAASLQLLS